MITVNQDGYSIIITHHHDRRLLILHLNFLRSKIRRKLFSSFFKYAHSFVVQKSSDLTSLASLSLNSPLDRARGQVGDDTRRQFGNRRRKCLSKSAASFRKQTWTGAKFHRDARRPIARQRLFPIFPDPASFEGDDAVSSRFETARRAFTSHRCNGGNWQAICARILAWKWKFGPLLIRVASVPRRI